MRLREAKKCLIQFTQDNAGGVSIFNNNNWNNYLKLMHEGFLHKHEESILCFTQTMLYENVKINVTPPQALEILKRLKSLADNGSWLAQSLYAEAIYKGIFETGPAKNTNFDHALRYFQKAIASTPQRLVTVDNNFINRNKLFLLDISCHKHPRPISFFLSYLQELFSLDQLPKGLSPFDQLKLELRYALMVYHQKILFASLPEKEKNEQKALKILRALSSQKLPEWKSSTYCLKAQLLYALIVVERRGVIQDHEEKEAKGILKTLSKAPYVANSPFDQQDSLQAQLLYAGMVVDRRGVIQADEEEEAKNILKDLCKAPYVANSYFNQQDSLRAQLLYAKMVVYRRGVIQADEEEEAKNILKDLCKAPCVANSSWSLQDALSAQLYYQKMLDENRGEPIPPLTQVPLSLMPQLLEENGIAVAMAHPSETQEPQEIVHPSLAQIKEEQAGSSRATGPVGGKREHPWSSNSAPFNEPAEGVSPETYALFLESMTKEKLEKAASQLRGGNYDAQNNCTYLALGVIEYLKKGLDTDVLQPASTKACPPEDYAVMLSVVAIKEENSPRRKKARQKNIQDMVDASRISNAGILDSVLPLVEVATHFDLTSNEGECREISSCFGQKTLLDSTSYDQLEQELKNHALQNQKHRVSFGFVSLQPEITKNTQNSEVWSGHMLAYFARPDKVFFIDAQKIDKQDQPAVFNAFIPEYFSHLMQGPGFVKSSLKNKLLLDRFQKKVFYMPVGPDNY